MRRERGLQVLAMTSATPGDGKTVTTLNLAGALAQGENARILVVDADLRRPSVSRYLGLDYQSAPGLSDTPPLLPLPDCRLIGKWVDGFLLIVGADKTPRRLVADALSLLDPAKV